jgi:hypothetical protein
VLVAADKPPAIGTEQRLALMLVHFPLQMYCFKFDGVVKSQIYRVVPLSTLPSNLFCA